MIYLYTYNILRFNICLLSCHLVILISINFLDSYSILFYYNFFSEFAIYLVRIFFGQINLKLFLFNNVDAPKKSVPWFTWSILAQFDRVGRTISLYCENIDYNPPAYTEDNAIDLCGDILKKKKKYLEYHLLRHEATVAMPNIHNLADESIPEIIALIYCSSRISRMKNPHEK